MGLKHLDNTDHRDLIQIVIARRASGQSFQDLADGDAKGAFGQLSPAQLRELEEVTRTK